MLKISYSIFLSSFAYKTVKDRLPVTITRAIDYISRFRSNLADQYSNEVIKFLILIINLN